jgi:hypothetical protein
MQRDLAGYVWGPLWGSSWDSGLDLESHGVESDDIWVAK